MGEMEINKVWDSFRAILVDARLFPPSSRHASLDQTVVELRGLIRELGPGQLRVVDQEILRATAAALTDDRLARLRAERRDSGLPDLSTEEIRSREMSRAAVLRPVDLMSFPHPAVRAELVNRFGAASVAGCLRDIFDLDPAHEVRAAVARSAVQRLGDERILPRERDELTAFVGGIVEAGFDRGEHTAAVRVIVADLTGSDRAILPEALRSIRTMRWTGGLLAGLSPVERSGVVRLFGEVMDALELLEHLEVESDHQVAELLLGHLDVNWDRGVAPEGGHGVTRRDLSHRIATSFIYKLHLEELSTDLRDHILRSEREEGGESRATALMRRLTVRALDDLGRQ